MCVSRAASQKEGEGRTGARLGQLRRLFVSTHPYSRAQNVFIFRLKVTFFSINYEGI